MNPVLGTIRLMKQVYADFAATTPTDPRVIAVMQPFFGVHFGNPSSLHAVGKDAEEAVSNARSAVANFLNAKSDEIYFTGSGTESNNLAILGTARANKENGKHIITSTIEHPSVLGSCRALERDGWQVDYIAPDKDGLLDPEAIASLVKTQTTLVTIHLANSEIGVIQDISSISAVVRKKNPRTLIHTDACQATDYLSLNVNELGVDLLTINGSKAYGPKGIACLYVDNSVSIFPLYYGGGQEQSLRSGTENVPGIVGFATALSYVCSSEVIKNISELRDFLADQLSSAGHIVNVACAPRLPNHLSVTLIDKTETDLVRALSDLGIAVSSGSACSSRSQADSHVLAALGLTSAAINQTIRITLGRSTTRGDCLAIVQAVQAIN